MKIEKINENKIRIFFDTSYLKENNINFHTFMSNSVENQDFFITILEQAKNDVGFTTDDFNLTIQTIFLSNGNFIITISKNNENEKKIIKVKAKKKNLLSNSYYIYKFATQSDIDNFFSFLKIFSISLNYVIYEFNNSFFLIIENFENNDFSKIIACLSEFAIPISNSELLFSKIKECGTEIKS